MLDEKLLVYRVVPKLLWDMWLDLLEERDDAIDGPEQLPIEFELARENQLTEAVHHLPRVCRQRRLRRKQLGHDYFPARVGG